MTPDLRLRVTTVLSRVMIVLGVVLLVETAIVGGGLGYLLGALLVLGGVGRLYVSSR
ncbi:MAG TPA: hypothetical protein VHQ96_04160 [Gaiellaceae bacterium]|jgi:hypothetical protein|nr:hypothetical protein [Gaiellaceae bacterium]